MDNSGIYEALSEIKERTASVETKVDLMLDNNKKLEDVKDIAVAAKNSADSAHRRLDRIDKWLYAIGSTAAIAIVGAILNLILNAN